MSDGPPGGTWNFQIVHMDIKPANGKYSHLARLVSRNYAVVKEDGISVRVLGNSLK